MTAKHIPFEHNTPEGRYYLIQSGYDVEGLKGWEKSAERWYGKAKFKIIKIRDRKVDGKKVTLYGLYRLRL